LGPWWNEDGALKEKIRKRKAEMTRRGSKMALGKVRRRGVYHLPSISIVFLFFFNFYFIFCDLNV